MTAQITLERDLAATLPEVWALWTTKDGIESWWGPDGFRVEVTALDLRPGGQLKYDMIAANPEMIAFMRTNGMPERSPTTQTYTEVNPHTRLAWVNDIDFVPGVPVYKTNSSLSLAQQGDRVHLQLRFDPMHDPVWSERQQQGWTMELGKLERLLAAR